MARSLNVTRVGKKQTYNYLDPENIHRAQKAINQRITDIANTFGVDSQIYRDYISPLVNEAGAQFVRIDKYGRTKLSTAKSTWETEDARALVSKMLTKATKGEILERTAEGLGGARSLQHAKKIKRKTGKEVEIIPKEDLMNLADSLHEMEMTIYSRLNEIYELGEQKNIDPRKGHLNRYKWYRELKKAHGKPSKELIEKAYNKLLIDERSPYLNSNLMYLGLSGTIEEGLNNDKF